MAHKVAVYDWRVRMSLVEDGERKWTELHVVAATEMTATVLAMRCAVVREWKAADIDTVDRLHEIDAIGFAFPFAPPEGEDSSLLSAG